MRYHQRNDGLIFPLRSRRRRRRRRRTAPPVEVLIIDNDRAHAEAVAESLGRIGFHCRVAASGSDGARIIEEQDFDVIITDLVMHDVDGLGILARAKSTQPDTEVILLTGHGTVQSAVEAMRKGAFNYLLKPLDIQQLRVSTEKAAESTRLRRANLELKRRLDERFGFEGVVGDSRQMRDVIERSAAHRAHRRHRAHPGRDRHRQGAGRPGHPPEQPAKEQALRGAESAPP